MKIRGDVACLILAAALVVPVSVLVANTLHSPIEHPSAVEVIDEAKLQFCFDRFFLKGLRKKVCMA